MFSKTLAIAATLSVSAALTNWTAVLTGVDGSPVAGTAVVAAVTPDSLRASVRVTGAQAGAEYPWMVHRGTCGANGAVFGNVEQYPNIQVGQDGTGQATALLAMAVPAEGDYSVHVHKSTTDLALIACGTLKPVSPSDTPTDTLERKPVKPQP